MRKDFKYIFSEFLSLCSSFSIPIILRFGIFIVYQIPWEGLRLEAEMRAVELQSLGCGGVLGIQKVG